jgi:hypothetical protein
MAGALVGATTTLRGPTEDAAVDTPAHQHVVIRWWPAVRRIDLVGVGILVALFGWTWWASQQQDADAGPLLWMLLGTAVAAALARWATFFHATAPAAAIAIGVAVYAISTGDVSRPALGAVAPAESAGAMFAAGTGAAGLVTLRISSTWPRLAFGLLTVALAALTWTSGSLGASVIAGFVVLVLVAYLAIGLKEPRWVVVWPVLVAILALLGTISYGLVVPVGDEAFLRPNAELHERWSTAVDVASEHPVTGVGVGATGQQAVPFADGPGWARHEPLQLAAETGVAGGLLLLALLGWVLTWIAQRGWRPGSAIAGAVVAGSVAHACFQPIWHAPAVPLVLAALAGTATMRGGEAAWRLERVWDKVTEAEEVAVDDVPPWSEESARERLDP